MPFVFLTLSVIFLIYQFITREESIPHSYYKSIRLNFNYALVSLVAYAIESDQRFTRLEFEYIRRQFYKIFKNSGESTYPSFYLKMLNIFRKENLPYQKVTDYLKTHESRDKRFTLLRLLYGVVVADNQITDNEWEFLRKVTVDLGLNLKDLDYINSLYQKQQAEKETKANYQQSYQQQAPRYTQSYQTDYYKVLGITPSATEAEIKKAYRSLAKKFHPDTVASFGEEIQKETAEKFRQIQEAYEKISTLRGIK